MIVTFTRRVKGKKDKTRLSISVPKDIIDSFKLFHKQPIAVTLQDRPMEPKVVIKFFTQLSLCGSQGLLIYLPSKDVKEYCLEKDMILDVTLTTMKEEGIVGVR